MMMSSYKMPYRARRRTVKRRFKIGPTFGRITMGAAILVLSIMAITQSINREAAVYESTEIRSEKGKLEQELNELRLLEARAKTLDRISKSTVKNEMTPVGDDVEYLDSNAEVAGAATTQP